MLIGPALKFHPDRNPGKELEFNAKFQAIQAANEILSDPTQRLRYDTDRLRAGYGKFYGPPKQAPPRKPAPAAYSSPPTAKPQNKKQGFATRPGSFQNTAGSQRYASYARAAPQQQQQQWQKSQDYGQTRADAFRGFQDMKGSAGWSNFDPRTGRGSVPRPDAGQSARPKSAYQYFRAAQDVPNSGPFNAQSTKKKQGFAPSTPGGDEPMATNTSAYTSTPRDHSQRWSSYFDSVPSPTAKKTAAPDAPRDKTGTFAERASSRYATTGGEKTFFSSAWLGRSASMRDPPPRSRSPRGTTFAAHSGRRRSTSPKSKDNRNRTFSSSPSSSETETEDEDEDLPPFRPKIPKSRLRSHQKFSGFHTQNSSNSGTGEHSSARSSLDDDRPSSRFHDPFDELRSYFRTGKDSSTDRDYVQGHDSDSAAFPRGFQRPFQFPSDSTSNLYGPSPFCVIAVLLLTFWLTVLQNPTQRPNPRTGRSRAVAMAIYVTNLTQRPGVVLSRIIPSSLLRRHLGKTRPDEHRAGVALRTKMGSRHRSRGHPPARRVMNRRALLRLNKYLHLSQERNSKQTIG